MPVLEWNVSPRGGTRSLKSNASRILATRRLFSTMAGLLQEMLKEFGLRRTSIALGASNPEPVWSIMWPRSRRFHGKNTDAPRPCLAISSAEPLSLKSGERFLYRI
jgi:hypothetical protein